MMTTDYKQIENLLNRFFDGETTNEEEQQLYQFFSRTDIPEHLTCYKSVFHYFENDLGEELALQTEPSDFTGKDNPKPRRLRQWITVAAGVAASLLILLMLNYLFVGRGDTFNPYEGSYIIRNGERITDIGIIKSELEATLQKAMLQEEEADRLYMRLIEPETQVTNIERRIEQQQDDIVNRFPDGMKEEVRKIIER